MAGTGSAFPQFRGIDTGEPDLFAGVGGAGIAVVATAMVTLDEREQEGIAFRDEIASAVFQPNL